MQENACVEGLHRDLSVSGFFIQASYASLSNTQSREYEHELITRFFLAKKIHLRKAKMGKQDFSSAAAAITSIISKTLASQLTEFSTTVTQSVNINQSNTNSSGCKNIAILGTYNEITVDTTTFSNQQAYQKAVNDITNSIVENFQQYNDKFLSLGSEQQMEIKTLVANAITNELTSQQITISSTTVQSDVNAEQSCNNSNGGFNLIIGEETIVTNAIYKSYSNNKAVQDVSNTVANLLDLKASQTEASFIDGIFKILAVVFVIVVIVAAILMAFFFFALTKLP